MLDAIVFSVVGAGFIPRSALETGKAAEPRVRRIVRAIQESRYSIHDLSRCRGEGDENLARFNMPLELGMSMARRFLDPSEEHDGLLLVPQNHAYQRYVSDLAGYDPVSHDGTDRGLVTAVFNWLVSRDMGDEPPSPLTPRIVLSGLPAYRSELVRLAHEWNGARHGGNGYSPRRNGRTESSHRPA